MRRAGVLVGGLLARAPAAAPVAAVVEGEHVEPRGREQGDVRDAIADVAGVAVEQQHLADRGRRGRDPPAVQPPDRDVLVRHRRRRQDLARREEQQLVQQADEAASRGSIPAGREIHPGREGISMRRHFGALCAALVLSLAGAQMAVAHPIEGGELYVPWGEKVGGERALDLVRGSAADDGGGTTGMALVGNADKDGTVNTDLAFNGNLVYAGNYSGFRILNASGASPRRSSTSRATGRRTTSRSTGWAARRSCSSRSTRRRRPRTARARTRRSSTAGASATRACASSTSRTPRSRSSST